VGSVTEQHGSVRSCRSGFDSRPAHHGVFNHAGAEKNVTNALLTLDKTMALFSRRCLQRLIEENTFLSPEQLKEHVRRLNKVREDYLATEWEIALLNALSKIGNVRHEPDDFGGNRFLDVVFESPSIQFGADIATVSDQQLHKRNPVDRIWMELARQARKRKIVTGGFEIDIGHSPKILQGRGIRHDLLMPQVGQLREVVFNAEFKVFMDRIVAKPMTKHDFHIRNSIADIKISYEPNRTTWGGSHLAYTGANILDDNPVFNALKRKAEQLKLSGYSGLRGVIVCDGGCEMLGEGGSWAEYPLRQVVGDFMRQNQSVGFVATIGLRHDRSGSIGRGHYKSALSVWVSRARAAEKQLLLSALEQMVAHLPTFETSAGNALGRLMGVRPRLGSHFGGYHMGGNQYMKLSAIGVLQLLAGTISYDEFAKAHGFENRNAFANAVRNGRVIRNCKIESGGEEDDDWITFEFGDPDPALAPFTAERSNSKSASGRSGG
jgi:PIN domain nuclease of toxin-antitoxin system